MGDGIIDSPSPFYPVQEQETRTLGDFITELCAYYMALGMPREDFLFGDDRYECEDFENAFECEQILANQKLHLQGLYNYRAFGSVLSSAFAGKGKKGEPYLSHPIPITEAEQEAEKKRKIMHTLSVVRNRERKRGDGNG